MAVDKYVEPTLNYAHLWVYQVRKGLYRDWRNLNLSRETAEGCVPTSNCTVQQLRISAPKICQDNTWSSDPWGNWKGIHSGSLTSSSGAVEAGWVGGKTRSTLEMYFIVSVEKLGLSPRIRRLLPEHMKTHTTRPCSCIQAMSFPLVI